MRLDHDVVCFGKIPEHGDFVRYNADGAAAREFDTWFREGLHASRSRLGHALKSIARKAGPQRFVYCPTTAPVLLFGVMQMSEDATGRTYPFVVATEVLRTEWSGLSMAHLPVSSVSFLDSAEALVEDAVAGNVTRSSLRELLLNVDPRKVGSDAVGEHEAVRFLDLMTFKGLAEGIWGSFDDSRKYLLFKNLADALAPLRGHIPARFSLGLRFPIAPFSVLNDDEGALLLRDTPAEVIVGFWFRVVHALADLQNVAPSFFWQAWASPAREEGSGMADEADSGNHALGGSHDPAHHILTETGGEFRIRSYRRPNGQEKAPASAPSPNNEPASDASASDPSAPDALRDEESDPELLYFFRPPPPNAFTQLLPVDQVETNICKLEASSGEKAAMVALSIPRTTGEALESETASLLDVIDAVRG